jgi:transposase-like protein
LNPKVVVTDGSNLYPGVLAELWSDAEHQLCVFHTIRTQSRTRANRRLLRLASLSTS